MTIRIAALFLIVFFGALFPRPTSRPAITDREAPPPRERGAGCETVSRQAPTAASTARRGYTDPRYMSEIPFGATSHWIQPWRAYLETLPATTYLNGAGVVLKPDKGQDLIVQMLAKHGIRQVRIEVNWNVVDFDDESKVAIQGVLPALAACKKYGLRPTILIYCHQGAPCPTRFFQRRLVADAPKGATVLTLDDTQDLRIGYSGVSNLTDYWAAEALITKIEGKKVTLSKPLPKELKAGKIDMATLKYQPFSKPGTPEYRETMAGWKRAVRSMCHTVAGAMGTTDAPERGFDVEVWNELTFGTNFLYINNYYSPKKYDYPAENIWGELVGETAAMMDASPTEFAGIALGDGFANTIPWSASSREPARVTGICKHPYPPKFALPERKVPGWYVNALGIQEDKPTFIPSYTVYFPEYSGNAIQTETLIRDMAPITNNIYNVTHGRNARTAGGRVIPVSVWITECNISPTEAEPNVAAERAMALKAKAAARFFCFYLNKGVTRLHLFASSANDKNAGDRELGIVSKKFLDYAAQPDAGYPADDAPFVSPVLAVTGRIAQKMQVGLNPALTRTRPLSVLGITDTHNHSIFVGDGTEAHPNLYDRDAFAFLPFQVNARKFVIPYYVMTRDVLLSLAPEKFTLNIGGLRGKRAKLISYNPYTDKRVPLKIIERGADRVTVQLTASDKPYLLIAED